MKDIIREAVARAELDARTIQQPAPRAHQPPSGAITNFTAREGDLDKVMRSLITKVKVIGCGGAGSNTIQRCLEEELGDIELIAVNTDAQHLLAARSPHKLLIGRHLTRGLGAGALPQ
ncbi:MAG TPA: cell division protein FtsZ, partial [Candidatus Thermoplasmatota archaeon]|nr:cell division protein FtsZ [Candidatus Thermoplasmatota archaeon]